MTKEKWIKDCSRMNMSDDDIDIWRIGEGHLSKLLGVKYASKVERDGAWVHFYYEEKQGKELHDAICKFLEKDGNFDKLCDDFVSLIMKKHWIMAQMMPFLIIADEIDNHPEIASEDVKRRLFRIRTSTHEESYK